MIRDWTIQRQPANCCDDWWHAKTSGRHEETEAEYKEVFVGGFSVTHGCLDKGDGFIVAGLGRQQQELLIPPRRGSVEVRFDRR
jgi:hypothetical protein